jgi:hypothetical protein
MRSTHLKPARRTPYVASRVVMHRGGESADTVCCPKCMLLVNKSADGGCVAAAIVVAVQRVWVSSGAHRTEQTYLIK